MREFGVRRILMRDGDGSPVEFSLDELLPQSFGPEALKP
jgi:cytidine deaminase